MSKHQSQFPINRSGLNYTLSKEPVLLNGMKILFDQSALVYSVNIESKDSVTRRKNIAFAHSFGLPALMTREELLAKAGAKPTKYRLSSSTYADIVDGLAKYEKTAEALEKLVLLMQVNDNINKWLDNERNTKKIERRKTLEILQQQIGLQIKELSKTPVVQKALPAEVVQRLLEGIDYAKSPTILFSYLMEKIVSIYRVGEITPGNFKVELSKFLLADNDILFSTSTALQSLGVYGDVKLGFDIAKFTMPCFEANVEVTSGTKIKANRLIATECQAVLNESGPIKRYSLMNMNGMSGEAALGAAVSVGVGWEKQTEGDSEDTLTTLEIAGLNLLPQDSPSASASAGASASVGGKATGIFLQVSDPQPTYFNLINEVEDKLFEIVTSKNKITKPTTTGAAYFSLFSHAYNADAEVDAGAGAEASGSDGVTEVGAEVSVEVKAGVYAGVKFSKYTYQTQLSNGIYKTQATTMFFKQVRLAAHAHAGAGVEVNVGQSKLVEKGKEIDREKEYTLLNALQYESGVIFWDKSTKEITGQEGAGFSIGHSMLAEPLRHFLEDPKKEDPRYVASLAQALGLAKEVMEAFLKEHSGLILDSLHHQENGHFLEATFIPSAPIDFALDKEEHPSARLFKQLSILEKRTLQSLRFRTALQDGKHKEKTWFKLGLNLKAVKLGIDLGRIEDAGSLKLTDYAVNWYDEKGKSTNSSSKKYVPASFLFM